MISIIRPSRFDGNNPDSLIDTLPLSSLPLGGGIVRIIKIKSIKPIQTITKEGDATMSDDTLTNEELEELENEFPEGLDEISDEELDFDLDEIPDEDDDDFDVELDDVPDSGDQSPEEEEGEDFSDLDEEDDFEGIDGE